MKVYNLRPEATLNYVRGAHNNKMNVELALSKNYNEYEADEHFNVFMLGDTVLICDYEATSYTLVEIFNNNETVEYGGYIYDYDVARNKIKMLAR